MNRSNNIQHLKSGEYDLCIIGGGASGAGCALDASLRGLRVALVEADDFASGASSKSTKLIHGGVRYLEQAIKRLDLGQLRQVRHGLDERQRVLTNAPHLTRPLPLITPVFSWWEGLYYAVGLRLYGLFAAEGDSLPGSRWLSKAEALQLFPGLSRRLHSAVLYYDGQFDDARYCLALIQTAVKQGAVAVNHAGVAQFVCNAQGQLTAALIEDKLSGETFPLRAKAFLNCTGATADNIRQKANPELSPRLKPSKGVHLALSADFPARDSALLIPKTTDGRVLFAIPYKSGILVGTTDTACLQPETEPVLEADEIGFLLETLNRYLDKPVQPEQIQAGFGGLRPLVGASSDKSTKRLHRDHEVEFDAVSQLFSLLGGKWTTYRLMAQDAVDAVCRFLGNNEKCRTADFPLQGAEKPKDNLAARFPIDAAQARHLQQRYGGEAGMLAELMVNHPPLARPLHPDHPYLAVEVVYAVKYEMACSIRDLLARRLPLELLDWDANLTVVSEVASLMAEELGWTEEETKKQTDAYVNLLLSFKQAAGLRTA